MEPTLRSLSGMVPEGASAAIIGVRIDSDGACACDGDGSATVGTIRYQEQRTGKQQAVWPGKPPASGPPPAFRTLKISHGSAFDPNLKQFKVTSGASYTFSAPISATASAANAGYATIIFLDAQGKGMKRDVLWFTPSQQDAGQLKTNADGRFSLSLSQALASSRPEVRVLYAGDDHLRPALAIADSH
jgi:hypothetical protein